MPDTENLTKIITAEHEKKWVALSRDYTEVVGFDESLVVLNTQIGEKDVVYMKIPPSDRYLTF